MALVSHDKVNTIQTDQSLNWKLKETNYMSLTSRDIVYGIETDQSHGFNLT